MAAAVEVATDWVDEGRDVTLVRDVVGRMTTIVGVPASDRAGAGDDQVDRLVADMADRLGRYARAPAVRPRAEVPWVDELEALPETAVLQERTGSSGRLLVVERTVTGENWARARGDAPGNRVTLYGFKGGVGRSTAAFLLAEHLGMHGQCVLVVDLDLESPGVAALLQPDDALPDHGVVDQLVESAVRSGHTLDLVARSRRARVGGNGEVWVAPAWGRPRAGYTYLPKLNRIYADAPAGAAGDSPVPFADRLDEAVASCEAQVEARSRRPDVVLLDSRAGIHDIAAVAITRLADLSLLFAADTPQTWAGYRELFGEWSRRPEQARVVRERLKLVAIHMPTADEARTRRLAAFRDRAQDCFAATLYDEAGPDEMSSDVFSFARDDDTAPHWPLPIPHVSGLVGLDPSSDGWQDNSLVREAFTEFTGGVDAMLEGSGT